MPQIANNFEYSGRKPLDSRQQCESLEILKANANNILYPPGFTVYCLSENKEYRNTAKLGEVPVWIESNVGKTYAYQTDEPANKDLLWFKESEAVPIVDEQYTTDDLVNLIKNYKTTVDTLVSIVETLQKDVAYIKKNGTVINPDNPEGDIDGALMTDDGCYLMTDDGCYLVI